MQPDQRSALAHVYWLGGSPCSGKSSIADLLAGEAAARGGELRVYHVDKAFETHRLRFTPEQQPAMFKWTHAPWEELWMQPADALLAETITCYSEHFQMIVEDLLATPRDVPLLVEGTSLMPDAVLPWLSDARHAIWVAPTEAFQRTYYPQRREWIASILKQCRDPDQAFQNWMDRDVAFARWVVDRAIALGLAHLWVDGERSIAENAALVAQHLGLP